MAHGNSKYLFLSRPRRFGKSLLTSTLHAYFEGRKDLFKGLAIEQLETEWTSYPVLHFDMSLGKHMDRKQLENFLLYQLSGQEKQFGISTDIVDSNIRLANLIQHAYEQTGRQVVVLIDEYDAPLLDVVHEEKDLPVLRNVMRNFYSPLKGCDPYLRFVFLTGITKFSQLSIFSELNNIQNISMLPEYAAVCGITQEEMEMQMDKDLDVLASRLELTREEMLQQLKDNYDGYHFTWPSPDLYNPFSLLNAFSEGRLNSYWFGSGTPTYLIEMLRKFQVIPQEIGGRKCEASDFDAPTERMTDITPLLYQSGYLTIKDYSAFSQLYLLDLPNREVRIGLMKSLLVNYVQRPSQINTLVGEMAEHIHFGRMEEALRLMQADANRSLYRALLRAHGLRGTLPADALPDFYLVGELCRCGGTHSERQGGRGDAHALHALCHRTEAGQECRSGDAADRPEAVSGTLCAVWAACGEGRHQL